MKLETAVVKILKETSNNIKKKQFLMDCNISLDKEKALVWVNKSNCKDNFILPEFCPSVKSTCRIVKKKLKIKDINPNCR